MSRAQRILIVEDQFFVAADCELQLKSAGYDCIELAATGSQAMEAIERQAPDLVLMDIRLANQGDGVNLALDIYRRLGIRCIFCSGHADVWLQEKAARARPLGWLDKPYSRGELLNAVEGALRQLERERQADGGTTTVNSSRND